MAFDAPRALDVLHHLQAFDCGKLALNHWLAQHARQAQASGSARTYVVAEQARVAGCFSLTVGHVDTMEAPDRVRKGIGAFEPSPVRAQPLRLPTDESPHQLAIRLSRAARSAADSLRSSSITCARVLPGPLSGVAQG